VKKQKVAEDLGVQYVLKGGVQKSDDRLRITVQLIDAVSGNYIWSERYDRQLKDIFVLQDEITINVMNNMVAELTEGEQTRRWTESGVTNLKALEKHFQAQGYFCLHTKENYEKARPLTEGEQARIGEVKFKNLDVMFKAYQASSEFRKGKKEGYIKTGQLAQEIIDLEPDSVFGYRMLAWNHYGLGPMGISPQENMKKAFTLECSGNSRSLLKKKASGNPWTIGGVGNAIWGGVWLNDLLNNAGIRSDAKHVCFEGFDIPKGKAQIKFIRSIPIEKALDSTILAYEMNGDPLPLEHGFPLRALALGWTGANCVKWLKKITLISAPVEGFFMDRVYRIFQKGEDAESGEVVTGINIKSIITQPLKDAQLPAGLTPIRGAAYAGEDGVKLVEVSIDDGQTWNPAKLIGLEAPYAWRHWEYMWNAQIKGAATIMSRATSTNGEQQPDTATWNVLGYCNNGVQEHGVTIQVM